MDNERTEITKIPAWMCGQEEYIPANGRESFLTKSTKSVLSVLANLRFNEGKDSRFSAAPSLKLFYTIFIFTLDITLKYISVLGEICMDVLRSVCLRSVGENPDKTSAFSGVLGITFLKASEMAEEMYAAMCCRGFTGKYEIRHKQKYSLIDLEKVCFAYEMR